MDEIRGIGLPEVGSPVPRHPRSSHCEHAVQFYDDQSFLVEQIAQFISPALATGGVALVIAANERVAELERLLADKVDLPAAKHAERLVTLEPRRLIAQFVLAGQVEPESFRTHVGGLVARAHRVAAGGPLRIYGEMVDLLWQAGEAEAVITVEDLWQELSARLPFSLLCGYHLPAFADQRVSQHFDDICARHTHVAPSERTQQSSGNGLNLRAVAQLEQKAAALELEIARRSEAEHAQQETLLAERAVRAEAELTASRLARLLAVADELTFASDRAHVADVIVKNSLVTLGATTGGLWLFGDDGALYKVRARGLSESVLEPFERIALDRFSPLTDAVRRGEPVLLGSLAEYAQRFPDSSLRTQMVQRVAPFSAIACLPLRVEGRSIGALSFGFAGPTNFSSEDKVFLGLLARQAAQAIESARLYAAERAGRELAEAAQAETEMLYALTSAANRADTLEEIFGLANQTIARATGIQRFAVLTFDPDGVMRFKHWHGLSEAYRDAVEGHTTWSASARGVKPITIEDVDRDPEWAGYLETFRAEHIRALAFIPLEHQERLLGKFMLYCDDPHRFSEREIAFVSAVAVHVAQAVMRTRAEERLADLYQKERRARVAAEGATRAREEILAVVSHDLRTPLNAITLAGANLSLHDADEANPERLHAYAERIQRNAERMARMIDDLVDFGSIQAGRLALDRQLHAPATIVAAAGELFQALAGAREIELVSAIEPDLPLCDCDRERTVQVLTNLLANAIKVSARGATVQIGARLTAGELSFYVADIGSGIAKEEQPHVFERYWRSTTAGYRGTGLGLSIAKGIVEAHGGRIWVESAPGTGAIFSFVMPLAAT